MIRSASTSARPRGAWRPRAVASSQQGGRGGLLLLVTLGEVGVHLLDALRGRRRRARLVRGIPLPWRRRSRSGRWRAGPPPGLRRVEHQLGLGPRRGDRLLARAARALGEHGGLLGGVGDEGLRLALGVRQGAARLVALAGRVGVLALGVVEQRLGLVAEAGGLGAGRGQEPVGLGAGMASA